MLYSGNQWNTPIDDGIISSNLTQRNWVTV